MVPRTQYSSGLLHLRAGHCLRLSESSEADAHSSTASGRNIFLFTDRIPHAPVFISQLEVPARQLSWETTEISALHTSRNSSHDTIRPVDIYLIQRPVSVSSSTSSGRRLHRLCTTLYASDLLLSKGVCAVADGRNWSRVPNLRHDSLFPSSCQKHSRELLQEASTLPQLASFFWRKCRVRSFQWTLGRHFWDKVDNGSLQGNLILIKKEQGAYAQIYHAFRQ